MQNFQDTFKTRKQSFISAFSVCMTVPLNLGNQSVPADSVKPFYKGWALLILSVSTLSFWFLTRFYIFTIFLF